MTCDLLRQWWAAAGCVYDGEYTLIQQAQPQMAMTNSKAKRRG